MLTLDDFQIELLAFELRFDHAYLLWDKAGVLWGHMSTAVPDLKPQSVQPNQQILSNRNLQLTLELGLLRLNVRGPKAAQVISEVGQELYVAACEFLRISNLTRVGFRSVRSKVYRDIDEALTETKSLTTTPNVRPFAENAKQLFFTVSNRFENDISGLLSVLKLERRDIDISAPWELMPFMADVKRSEIVLSLDADYYTVGTTTRDALSADLWISQAEKTIKRHWVGVLG